MAELWDIYDRHCRKTGKIVERGQMLGQDEYHMVVNVWLRNEKKEFLISRRAVNKSDPLCWECTGGSALAGEESLEAALREVHEELGIILDPKAGRKIITGFRHYDHCSDFVDVWLFGCDVPINAVTIQPEETCDAKWASVEEIRMMIERGLWIPMNQFDYIDVILQTED